MMISLENGLSTSPQPPFCARGMAHKSNLKWLGSHVRLAHTASTSLSAESPVVLVRSPMTVCPRSAVVFTPVCETMWDHHMRIKDFNQCPWFGDSGALSSIAICQIAAAL